MLDDSGGRDAGEANRVSKVSINDERNGDLIKLEFCCDSWNPIGAVAAASLLSRSDA